jgi:hypothetical protein
MCVQCSSLVSTLTSPNCSVQHPLLVQPAGGDDELHATVHRLKPSKLGYCAWVRARNCEGVSNWSTRFVFHAPARSAPGCLASVVSAAPEAHQPPLHSSTKSCTDRACNTSASGPLQEPLIPIQPAGHILHTLGMLSEICGFVHQQMFVSANCNNISHHAGAGNDGAQGTSTKVASVCLTEAGWGLCGPDIDSEQWLLSTTPADQSGATSSSGSQKLSCHRPSQAGDNAPALSTYLHGTIRNAVSVEKQADLEAEVFCLMDGLVNQARIS